MTNWTVLPIVVLLTIRVRTRVRAVCTQYRGNIHQQQSRVRRVTTRGSALQAGLVGQLDARSHSTTSCFVLSTVLQPLSELQAEKASLKIWTVDTTPPTVVSFDTTTFEVRAWACRCCSLDEHSKWKSISPAPMLPRKVAILCLRESICPCMHATVCVRAAFR